MNEYRMGLHNCFCGSLLLCFSKCSFVCVQIFFFFFGSIMDDSDLLLLRRQLLLLFSHRWKISFFFLLQM